MVAYFPIKTSAKHYYLTDGAQGQVKLAKKSSTYNVTHKKPAPQPKNFFRVQTTRLAVSFDTSTRSVTRTGVDIPAQSHVRSSCFFANRLN